MKPAIHYAFEAKLIKRKKEDGEFEFIEVFKEFFDDEPIKAREAAFRYYQNYIDVLLESKGLKYESDKQAKESLESYYDPKTSHPVDFEGKISFYPDSWGNGIGVFMIIDDEFDEHYVGTLKTTSKKEMIHGIGNLWEGDSSPETLTLSLEREIEYYDRFKYDTGNYKTTIVFCNSDEWVEGYRDDEPSTYTILKTPFDWTGMDKPYWWGEPEKDREDTKTSVNIEERIKSIMRDGEGNQIEFRPALYYFDSTKTVLDVKKKNAKTICAFLNSKGGYLFIGVNDKGKAIGLKNDFSLSKNKNPKDYFQLQFDNILKQYFPLSIKENIYGDFYKIDKKEIFVITVFPSKSNPVFISDKESKEFYVRWTGSSIQYKDTEEITKYCLGHWNKNNS
jgi:hypothetical protein